ncbi:sucrase ferredoxin [Egicoccus halophilus]|uniref:Sucrase ferredoxin n=1 Tax=Egicoccus halophilus TaxID=1670830 RepID=A0A8J3EUB7_9ACTN|nr:sucrase ferredoxin [Egicoccus halophilus]GGI05552.1 sucrase ferredoxin [Egicoccus halophilus]
MTGRCAMGSRARGERPLGTASRARRWLLLEQPGPWGRDAVAESDLPPSVAAHLEAVARELPARVLLLRRPGGERPLGTERRLYAGVTTAHGSWLEALELDHVDDVLDLDLQGLREGTTVGGVRVIDPLYLVCTNGKHDPCCAKFGLPVAQELAEVVGQRVWECSHVGGDRFAGNLVCLPDGLFYGQLDPASARTVVAAHEGGRIELRHFRGRSCHAFPVQAAEVLVRERLDVQGTDAIEVVDVERQGDRHVVRFLEPGGGRLRAELVTAHDTEPVPLTCHGGPARAPRYELVDLRSE